MPHSLSARVAEFPGDRVKCLARGCAHGDDGCGCARRGSWEGDAQRAGTTGEYVTSFQQWLPTLRGPSEVFGTAQQFVERFAARYQRPPSLLNCLGTTVGLLLHAAIRRYNAVDHRCAQSSCHCRFLFEPPDVIMIFWAMGMMVCISKMTHQPAGPFDESSAERIPTRVGTWTWAIEYPADALSTGPSYMVCVIACVERCMLPKTTPLFIEAVLGAQ